MLVALTIFFPTTLCLYLVWSLSKFIYKVWWRPLSIQKFMKTQGVKGPPYKFPHGCAKEIATMRALSLGKPMDISHDIFPRIQPHVYSWIKIYGKNFLTWHGPQAQLFVTEPEFMKEILCNKDDAYPKTDVEGYAKKLLGESLITNEGEKWAKIRKLANHTFHSESLKGMVPEISSSVETMLEKWKQLEGREVDIYKDFGILTSEVISRTAFGSSFGEGKHIFEMVDKLIKITIKNVYTVRFPGISWFIKTDDEVESDNLERSIKSSIFEIVKKREKVINNEDVNFANDFLGQLIKIVHNPEIEKRITMEQMINEIKMLYGSGHLTTTNLLSWCVFLLAIHTDWQEKARKEVLDLFGRNHPTSDDIARLKTMNMIINETLRLYPPAITIARKTQRKIKLGSLTLPPNINLFFSILALHHNPEIWGEDVHLFKPERFAHGVAKATNNNPAAFYPFGMGPRTCVGLNFSTNETKITLSMILQRYKFTLSPNYVHYPDDIFVLTPKTGVQVVLQEI